MYLIFINWILRFVKCTLFNSISSKFEIALFIFHTIHKKNICLYLLSTYFCISFSHIPYLYPFLRQITLYIYFGINLAIFIYYFQNIIYHFPYHLHDDSYFEPALTVSHYFLDNKYYLLSIIF